MSQASEQIANQYAAAANIKKIWEDIIINVKAVPFNAKGDNVKDDTIAIQKAIDYARSIGKTEVTFPAGTYLYGVLMNTEGMTFLGDGVTLNGGTRISITSIAALKADVAKIKNRYFIYFGDSYMVGTGGTDNKIPLTIASLINCTWKNYAVGGSGFIRKTTPGNVDFLAEINTAIADPTLDKSAVTDIVIAGGYNDMGLVGGESWNQTAFTTAIKNMVVLIKANFPYAKITVIPFPWINAAYNADFRKLSKWLENAAQLNGCNTSHDALNWLINESANVNSGDGVHPSDAGYDILSSYILSTMLGTTVKREYFDIITATTGDIILVFVDNGFLRIQGNITVPGANGVFSKILTLPSWCSIYSNYPVPLYKYGDYTLVRSALIMGRDINTAGDQFTNGVWLLDVLIPFKQ